MTRHEAIVMISATLEIEQTDAADLIDEYALNTGEARNVEEIIDVTSERVQQICADYTESKERHSSECICADCAGADLTAEND